MCGCHNSKKSFKSDNVVISQKVNGVYTKEHYRQGFRFVDQIKGKKILEREVYFDDSLMYRHPINQSQLMKSKFRLYSGNNFLTYSTPDTLEFINRDLPSMNRHFWGTGVTIKTITDKLYLIRPIKSNLEKAYFYISVSSDMDEIKNSPSFISDTLVLPIR